MKVKKIRQAGDLKNKRVLVRVDFNVPIKNGKVLDDSRLRASLPTIKYLIENKAIVILVTHLGRPGGKKIKALSVEPVAQRLSQLIGKDIKIFNIQYSIFNKQATKIKEEINKIKPGQVVMLENIRFSPQEENDSGTLAQDLAGLADIFVLDGFAVAHRESASVSGVPKFIPSYAGLLLESEINGLNKVLKKSKKPFVVVLGGVKIETKIPVIKNLLGKTSKILLGGGLTNTYLKAKGYQVGDSLVDSKFGAEALRYGNKKKVITPIDVVVGRKEGKHFRVVDIAPKSHQICKKGEGIFDIGPKTIQLYAGMIKKANTLVWNGAMGYFEQKPYDIGTLSIARLVSARSKGKAYGIIGGGETLQAMEITHMSEFVDLVSTGGGAMLEYLSGKKLSGIEALKKKSKFIIHNS
ncbi:phosphoglycerate kinase [Patescibacteria group bacterium]|nr:phosphoglycerate kinase [Patescibacteria group bacterium]MBU1895718.1 phosphoglycerate kinase [Patescibacteria group bacterium]